MREVHESDAENILKNLRLKQAVSKPVLVAGRINQPQIAESILLDGKADMIGMARALIADPEFVAKLEAGNSDQIRACVACNQACVGHRLAHHPVSCIQNPMTGREHQYASVKKPSKIKKERPYHYKASLFPSPKRLLEFISYRQLEKVVKEFVIIAVAGIINIG